MLEVRNVSKAFAAEGTVTQALHRINLAVAGGDFVSVAGPSGSGKSTLLGVMSTLVAPDEGAVLYNGENVAAMGERGVDRLRRRDFGVVFQFHHLMPTMTALENVLLPFLHRLRPVGASLADRARECLERVGLAHKADCLPAHLSGGEQQRVAIARALVKRSRILFADEPTGSLDSATGDRIMELLCGLNAEGLAVVMVTHNEEYAALARTRLTMRDGMLADAGGTCCAACPA